MTIASADVLSSLSLAKIKNVFEMNSMQRGR
jgi:hypothetical protein